MIIVLFLAIGVFAYFVWRHRTSGLYRTCRWREERSAGQWRCLYCGAVEPGNASPNICRNIRPPD